MSEDKRQLVMLKTMDHGNLGNVYSLLDAETGEHLTDHFCTNSSFAYNDLWGRREERREEIEGRLGECKVNWLEDLDITKEELQEKNKKFYKEK